MKSTVADRARQDLLDRQRRLSPAERVQLALSLGARDAQMMRSR